MSRKKSNFDRKTLIEIGGRIRSIRKYLRLTQVEFAESIGISANYISTLENGEYAPSKLILLNIEHQYLIKPEQILTGQGFSFDHVRKSSLKEGELDLRPPALTFALKEPGETYQVQSLSIIQMAEVILNSQTEYAVALAPTIRAFYNAIEKEQRTLNLEKRLASLEEQFRKVNADLAKFIKE